MNKMKTKPMEKCTHRKYGSCNLIARILKKCEYPSTTLSMYNTYTYIIISSFKHFIIPNDNKIG